MTQMDIAGNRVDVDPSLRVHIDAYNRLAALAMAAASGEATRDETGLVVFDGLVGAGEALDPQHISDGVVAQEANGTQYDFRLFDDHGNPVPVRTVLNCSTVDRDALGLARQPGVNGLRGRLTIRETDGTFREAVSTGSEHDWRRVA